METFKMSMVAAENELQNTLQSRMTDNSCELSTGMRRSICNEKGIKISTTTPYHAASNRATECAIRCLPVQSACARLRLPNTRGPRHVAQC